MNHKRENNPNFIHGLTKTVEYNTWASMKSRCSNPDQDTFKRYLHKGIKVCKRWSDSFENFLEDMGKRPSNNHSLDRINSDGDYEPSNCRWSTKSEQVRNTGLFKNNTSGVRGVRLKGKNYECYISVKSKFIFIGKFDTCEEAVKARKEAEFKYWGKSS